MGRPVLPEGEDNPLREEVPTGPCRDSVSVRGGPSVTALRQVDPDLRVLEPLDWKAAPRGRKPERSHRSRGRSRDGGGERVHQGSRLFRGFR